MDEKNSFPLSVTDKKIISAMNEAIKCDSLYEEGMTVVQNGAGCSLAYNGRLLEGVDANGILSAAYKLVKSGFTENK